MTTDAANATIKGTFIAAKASAINRGDVLGWLISTDTPFLILTISTATAIWVDRLFR